MPTPQLLDLSHIKTPEELLKFITGMGQPAKPQRTCTCGWTLENFDKTGRFGCPKCYEIYLNKLEQLVFPYHGASQHVGKRMKHQVNRQAEFDSIEKEKLLKLRLAKAVELEEYEKAAEIKKELDQLKSELQPSTSLDQ
jgi:protein arginine kinase activator